MESIEDLILHRRLQLLIHSCIYYNMDTNIIDDRQWDIWAKELVQLQTKYPLESSKVKWAEAFKDWDGSTGAFLPLNDPWVRSKAAYILKICGGKKDPIKPKPQPKTTSKKLLLF